MTPASGAKKAGNRNKPEVRTCGITFYPICRFSCTCGLPDNKGEEFPHFHDIRLVVLLDSLALRLSFTFLWSPAQLPLCEITVGRQRRTRLHVATPEDIVREVPLEASS